MPWRMPNKEPMQEQWRSMWYLQAFCLHQSSTWLHMVDSNLLLQNQLRKSAQTDLQGFFDWELVWFPMGKETKLSIAAVANGKNKGDGAPNSNSPWLYRLLCSSSTTLLVTLNPYGEIPNDFRRYSTDPNEKPVSPRIIHALWLFHQFWVVPPNNMKSR